MRTLTLLAALLAATAGLGCATAQARTGAVGPALDPPSPPPHEVRVPPVADPPQPTSDGAGARSAQAPPRAPLAKPADAPPATPVTAAPDTPPPPPPLETTKDVAEAARRVRALLDSAVLNLDRTDYRVLNTELKAEYDVARRFVRQANDALKLHNVSYAEQFAGKAATIAARLAQREAPRPSTAEATPA